MNDASALNRLASLGYLRFGGDASRDFISEGVREFQVAYKLDEQSGDLNQATREALELPRCGFPDRENLEIRVLRERRGVSFGMVFSLNFERFSSDSVAVKPVKWPDTSRPFTLRYEFGEGAAEERQAAVVSAMRKWSDVGGGGIVKFEPANGGSPHFNVSWVDGNALEPNYIAAACLPGDCNLPMPIRFNKEKSWSTSPEVDNESFRVEKVALHEIGHVLGLVHPPQNNDTIMSALLLKGGELDLASDDKDALRLLYL